MAWWRDRPTPRPLPDPEPTHPGALLRPRREDFAANRWARQLHQSQALKVFRKSPVRTGKIGRPKLVLPAEIMIARVIKRYRQRRVVEAIRRVVLWEPRRR